MQLFSRRNNPILEFHLKTRWVIPMNNSFLYYSQLIFILELFISSYVFLNQIFYRVKETSEEIRITFCICSGPRSLWWRWGRKMIKQKMWIVLLLLRLNKCSRCSRKSLPSNHSRSLFGKCTCIHLGTRYHSFQSMGCNSRFDLRDCCSRE